MAKITALELMFSQASDLGAAAGAADATHDSALLSLLTAVNGKTDQASVDLYRTARNGWKHGYAMTHGITANGASQQWSRITRRLMESGAFVAPATPEMVKNARRMQLARKSVNQTDAMKAASVAAGGVAAPTEPTPPVKGATAAEKARAALGELSAMEVHLLVLIRAHKAKEAAAVLADLAK